MKFIYILIIFFGCAHTRSVKENVEGIEESQNEISQSVEDKVYEEEVVSDHVSSQYSVSMMGDSSEAFSYVGLLKKMEKEGIEIIGLSGQGTAAVIAGLYAKHGKASMVEWILFKYFEKFFPFKEEFKEQYTDTMIKLIKREFKGLDQKKYALEFQTGSLLTNFQFILNEFEKEKIKEGHTYKESACVYESAHYQEYINLCFFSHSSMNLKHDDIDRKSFSVTWNKAKGYALVDIIESKNKEFKQFLEKL